MSEVFGVFSLPICRQAALSLSYRVSWVSVSPVSYSSRPEFSVDGLTLKKKPHSVET